VGSVLLTLILGGAHGPILEEKALAELSDILQIRQGVRVLHGHTWEMAIPQKNIGYAGVLVSIRAFEAAHPGFRFVGNAVSGVSVGDVIDYAASVTTAL
jgi:protoporphyrinogen oxidase